MKRSPILPEPQPTLGEVHIDIERCKGCELCIDYCPVDVLVMAAEYNVKGYHYPETTNEDCITCQSCFVICPEFAIFATPIKSTQTSPAVGAPA
ncbi:MAG: 4Fe-4S dicluster domain-containing protein [SAR202 cluster bacterium]|nr:4Fe-4S ferredoxin [Chloroflexota bacterium]MDP6664002.1 4Fe-4S binding protein [SAR202 cluster bacterium]MQG56523.1 4Fe-4S dicluster domain-containing protein [SAR202 cluster bacterium]MQG68900.1 4Fe-4S dicluster domain-containing protein [SAR202 cluster bacterium]HAL48592.1 4Fe-4S ferredoxin [Dehalococcoidia bacterium]